MNTRTIIVRKLKMQTFARQHGLGRVLTAKSWTIYNLKLAHWGGKEVAVLKSIQAYLHMKPTGVWDIALQRVFFPAPPKSKVERLLDIERHEIGVKERPPNTNRGPRVDQYEATCGIKGEPWCGCFQNWALDELGYKGPRPPRPASVESWADWAKANHLTVGHADPGDFVCFDWQHDGHPDHIGIVEDWPTTIEGNTSLGNQSNGGEVMRRTRSVGDVACFIRLHL